MKIEIDIDDTLTQPLADLLGVPNKPEAIGLYYSKFIAQSLATFETQKERQSAEAQKLADYENKIKPADK